MQDSWDEKCIPDFFGIRNKSHSIMELIGSMQ